MLISSNKVSGHNNKIYKYTYKEKPNSYIHNYDYNHNEELSPVDLGISDNFKYEGGGMLTKGYVRTIDLKYGDL